MQTENKLPRHIAIIMDGNGRWAQKRGLPRIEGHKKGAENARRILEALIDCTIPHVTLYVFSTENWNRPIDEVSSLFKLLSANLDEGEAVALQKGARIQHMGSTEGLPDEIKNRIWQIVDSTKENRNIHIMLAFNYGAREEIVRAVRSIMEKNYKAEDVTEAMVSENLYSAGIPDPDLVIRTGGEMRLSNFLLWQAAYAEIYFTRVLWPDFSQKELGKALAFYSRRQRRFGRLPGNEVKS